MFALNERVVEPLGESKNDIEIIMELAKRIGLEDEVLSSDYESYMDYILKPSGLTLQDLREHPQGMKGKVLILQGFRRTGKNRFTRSPGRLSCILWRLINTGRAEGMNRFRYTTISGIRGT